MALEATAKAIRRKVDELGAVGTLRLMAQRALERLLRREQWLYYADLPGPVRAPRTLAPDAVLTIVESEAGLAPADVQAVERYAGEAYCRTFATRLADGWTLLLAHVDGNLAGGVWAVTERTSWKSKVVPLLPGDVAMVDAFTFPASRGRGVYPFLLASIADEFAKRGFRRTYGYVSEWNAPSVRGLEKAGFVRALAYEAYELGGNEIVVWKRVRPRA